MTAPPLRQHRSSISVLVRHPAVGSLWLDDAYIEGDVVIGEAWDESDCRSPMLPDDYRGQPVTMNFPVGCIVKWSPIR